MTSTIGVLGPHVGQQSPGNMAAKSHGEQHYQRSLEMIDVQPEQLDKCLHLTVDLSDLHAFQTAVAAGSVQPIQKHKLMAAKGLNACNEK